jgi:hypothetical protein
MGPGGWGPGRWGSGMAAVAPVSDRASELAGLRNLAASLQAELDDVRRRLDEIQPGGETI